MKPNCNIFTPPVAEDPQSTRSGSFEIDFESILKAEVVNTNRRIAGTHAPSERIAQLLEWGFPADAIELVEITKPGFSQTPQILPLLNRSHESVQEIQEIAQRENSSRSEFPSLQEWLSSSELEAQESIQGDERENLLAEAAKVRKEVRFGISKILRRAISDIQNDREFTMRETDDPLVIEHIRQLASTLASDLEDEERQGFIEPMVTAKEQS